jgi:hypothetical protein
MISFLVLAFASGLAFAQATQPAGKTHDVTGAVVKTDAAAKSLTLDVSGKEMTLKVEGEAANQLKDLKAGDKVTVSCRDDANGAHQAITKIVKAKAT